MFDLTVFVKGNTVYPRKTAADLVLEAISSLIKNFTHLIQTIQNLLRFCLNSTEMLNLNEKSRKKCQRIMSTGRMSIIRNKDKCPLKKYAKLGTAEEMNQTLFFGR